MNAGQKTISIDEVLSQLSNGMDFSHKELHDMELVQTAAHDLSFRQCTFVNVDMTDVDWENLKCQSSKFINCRFIDANLENALFENCSFFEPDRSTSCNFMHANLRSASFQNCDLSGCVFEGADLFRISIQDSKATGAKFFRASFNGSAKLSHNVLRYADLRGANFAKCNLAHNDLVWATLDEADFTRANLMGCDLGGATTRYTKFAGADLRGAVLTGFDVRTMDIGGAQIFESQMRQLLENCGLIIFPDNRS
ncbi:MAG: pentapeptide repeat-containing protein [Chloroflexi bacterium]|nr:pentapeptide repeat-containing protein [Chloroflexota bacterium]